MILSLRGYNEPELKENHQSPVLFSACSSSFSARDELCLTFRKLCAPWPAFGHVGGSVSCMMLVMLPRWMQRERGGSSSISDSKSNETWKINKSSESDSTSERRAFNWLVCFILIFFISIQCLEMITESSSVFYSRFITLCLFSVILTADLDLHWFFN